MRLAYAIQSSSFSAVATREIARAYEYDIAPIRNSSSIIGNLANFRATSASPPSELL
ncbi:MAG: hypothetical protein KBG15_15740 [Kofleriaceae bacterium]|nr:hypothetical protein [Kofleriaceae bacterium]